MPGVLKVLPLSFVMIAGPQIITAVFLAMSETWKKNSASFVVGALLAVSLFVTIAYVVARVFKGLAGNSHQTAAGRVIDVVILVLLVVGAAYIFRGRKNTQPPKWMSGLENATPKRSFVLGFLLLGVFPTDIITSTVVGFHLARSGDPWWYCLSFVVVTMLLVALPVLIVLVLGKRATVVLPKARDWMNANSWIISEVVIGLFIGIEINSLFGS